jgi:hypothetical protein
LWHWGQLRQYFATSLKTPDQYNFCETWALVHSILGWPVQGRSYHWGKWGIYKGVLCILLCWFAQVISSCSNRIIVSLSVCYCMSEFTQHQTVYVLIKLKYVTWCSYSHTRYMFTLTTLSSCTKWKQGLTEKVKQTVRIRFV